MTQPLVSEPCDTPDRVTIFMNVTDRPYFGRFLTTIADADEAMANGKANNAASDVDQSYIAVFSSAEASFYVANGTRRVLVIGGYTGLMTTPTVDELSALLDQNRIRYAIVPGPLDTRATDPRIQMITQRCHPRVKPRMDDGAYMYMCGWEE